MAETRSKKFRMLAGTLPTLPNNLVIPAPRKPRSQAQAVPLQSQLAATSSAAAQNKSNKDDSDSHAFTKRRLESPPPQYFIAPKAGAIETMPNIPGTPLSGLAFNKERLLAIGRGHKVTDSQSRADGYDSCDESDSSHENETVVNKSPR